MDSSEPQRDFARQVVQKLRDAGHQALWAGGCVRDELLGRPPKDYDVATSALPEQVRELFGRKRTLAIGASFGVISVLGGKQYDPIEVATFRSDGDYLDGRHPTEVTFTSAEEDAQRRDFTINGLFFDPLKQQLIDYVSGEQDLKVGVVRAIGDASARFAEDKLRMLRAVRFATTFDFSIDATTQAAIHSMATEVTVVSAERIGVELRKILQSAQRARGLELLRQTGLLKPLFPVLDELAQRDEAAWHNIITRLQALETESMPVAFAALFCDTPDAQGVIESGRSFRFTNKEIDRASWLVATLGVIRDADSLPWPRLQRVLAHEGAADLLKLAEATWGTDQPGVQVCRERLALPAEQLNPPLLITGDDLVAHGLRPGKHFGELLDYLRDLQLDGKLSSADEALVVADQWVRQNAPG